MECDTITHSGRIEGEQTVTLKLRINQTCPHPTNTTDKRKIVETSFRLFGWLARCDVINKGQKNVQIESFFYMATVSLQSELLFDSDLAQLNPKCELVRIRVVDFSFYLPVINSKGGFNRN